MKSQNRVRSSKSGREEFPGLRVNRKAPSLPLLVMGSVLMHRNLYPALLVSAAIHSFAGMLIAVPFPFQQSM